MLFFRNACRGNKACRVPRANAARVVPSVTGPDALQLPARFPSDFKAIMSLHSIVTFYPNILCLVPASLEESSVL